MESSALTQAYDHARSAAKETKASNLVAAEREHDLAADHFSTAASGTKDVEALRILQLLEKHHRQLASILKTTSAKPAECDPSSQPVESASDSKPVKAPAGTPAKAPRLAQTSRGRDRDYSGSIIEVLATARGRPPVQRKKPTSIEPTVSEEHADATFTQSQPRQPSQPSWTPPQTTNPIKHNSTPRAQAAANAAANDAPFQQFYSTFGGLINKISAPLAFASLPLSQSSTDTSNPTSQISKAALNAISNTRPANTTLAPHESFMILPPTSAMSYADITALTRSAHHRSTSQTSTDDFVDAQSQILEHPTTTTSEPKHQGKTMEELALENAVLRHTTNDITKRLQAFEMSAQVSSNALAQSIRSLTSDSNSRGPSSTPRPTQFDSVREKAMKKRIEELEEVLRRYDRKLSKREEENGKLRDVVGKYREKWDGLKAGARARREAERPGGPSRTVSAATNVSVAEGGKKPD